MKKGFTLIELLGTIVILGLIALIATPPIVNIIKRSTSKIDQSTLRFMYSNGQTFVLDNAEDYNMTEGNSICVQLDTLIEEGALKESFAKTSDIDRTKYLRYQVGINDKLAYDLSLYDIDQCDEAIVAELKLGQATTNRIQIFMDAKNSTSKHLKYEFSIDNGKTWSAAQDSNVYSFSNLKNNTTYIILANVVTESGKKIERQLSVKTPDIGVPTYAIDKTGWQKDKTVTITYPTKQTGFVFQYSVNGGTSWNTVASGTTFRQKFTANGTIIARVYDGSNYKTASSYTVSQIDNTPPVCTTTGGTSSLLTSKQTITGTCSSDVGSGCKTSVRPSRTFPESGTVANGSYSPGVIEDNVGNKTTCPTAKVNVNTTDYVVTFKNCAGSTIKTQSVKYNGSASAPAAPHTDTYKFHNWNGSYTGVTSNRTVTANCTNLNANIFYGACFGICNTTPNWQYSGIIAPDQAYYNNQVLTDFTFASAWTINIRVHAANTGWNCTNCRWRTYPASNGGAQHSSVSPNPIQAIQFTFEDSSIRSTHKFCCSAYYNGTWHPAEAGSSTSSPGQCGTVGQAIDMRGFKFYFKLKGNAC